MWCSLHRYGEPFSVRWNFFSLYLWPNLFPSLRLCGELWWVLDHDRSRDFHALDLRLTNSAVVVISVVDAQRKILLSPTGSNVWSGQTTQSLNSSAVTWSLAKQLYGFNGPHWIVPMSLLLGMVPTTIQYLIHRVRFIITSLLCAAWKPFKQRWPMIGPVKVSSVMLPIIYMVSVFHYERGLTIHRSPCLSVLCMDVCRRQLHHHVQYSCGPGLSVMTQTVSPGLIWEV